MITMITSTSNPAVKHVVSLCQKAKERNAQGLFVVEGPKMFAEAPGERVEQVYVSQSFYERSTAFLAQQEKRLAGSGAGIQLVSDSVLRAMSDTKAPQGIVCLVRQAPCSEEDLTRSANDEHPPFCMVLENLQDPGNLGTIVRTAEGAGVTGILLGRGCVDIYNPKVIRSTMGSIYRMPFAYTDDLQGVLREWKSRGIVLCAAHLRGDRIFTDGDYTGGCAFMIGNESRGLTDELSAMADQLVKIPMQGKVESLNASVAAAILMYEVARQRG